MMRRKITEKSKLFQNINKWDKHLIQKYMFYLECIMCLFSFAQTDKM